MKECPELILICQILQSGLLSTPEPLVPSTTDWPLLYNKIIRHRIWHQIKKSPLFSQDNLTNPISAQLTKQCQKDTLRTLAKLFETSLIAKAFNQGNIQYCVLKGVVLNMLIYDAPTARPCKDIDIWVAPKDYAAATRILLDIGYQKISPKYELKGFKERYYMSHKYDMEFYHPQRKQIVELHFWLNYLSVDFFIPTASMLKTIQICNTPVMTFEDDYHLLFLMIHGAIHAWIRLRWLHDIALFVHSNRCDLLNVMKLAKQIDCEHIVQQSLILVHDLFNLKTRDLCQLIQNPSRRVRALTSISKQYITSDYVMTDSVRNPKMFFKYRFYLVYLAVKQRRLSAITGDLFKIEGLFRYFTFPDKLSFMYYVLYPGWVCRFVWRAWRR